MMTHYDLLEVPVGADIETIRKAYRAALKKYHPDLHEGDPAAELHSKRIIDAYNVLKDPDQRAIYDEQLTRRAQQKRRLFLITVLVSAGLACGAGFGVLWTSNGTPETSIAALPPSQPPARSDTAGKQPSPRGAAPEAAIPTQTPSPPAPEKAARAEPLGNGASDRAANIEFEAVSGPLAPAEIAAPKPKQVAEAAASPAPASAPEGPVEAETPPAASAADRRVTKGSQAGSAAPGWIVKAGEAHSSVVAPDPVTKAEKVSPPSADPAPLAAPESAGNRRSDRIARAEPSLPTPASEPEAGLPVVAALAPPAGSGPDIAVTPPPHPSPAPRQEVSWADIERSGDLEVVWKFIQEAPTISDTALAVRRLETLIETTDDVASLETLRAVTNGAIAQQVQRRLDTLTGTRNIITGTITERSDTWSAQIAPGPGGPAASDPAVEETAAEPGASPQPREAEKQIKAGLAALKTGNHEKALAAFDTAIRLDGSNARGFINRAAAWESKGDLDQALADYNAGIGLDPANISALQARGLLLGRRGEFDQALLDLERAIRMNFGDAKAYRDRGMIWLEMGRYNRAITDFSRAVAIDPDLASAYVGRGRAFLKKGDTITASVNFDKAARRDASAAKEYRELKKNQLKDASIQ